MIGLTETRQATLQLRNTSLFRQHAYVDGRWCDADGGATIQVMNPSTGALVGVVPKMGAAETRRAIEAAAKAMPAWRAKTAKERAAILRRWYESILAHQDDLAWLRREQGSPSTRRRPRSPLAPPSSSGLPRRRNGSMGT
jgi:succinate-semialdehyde dehydrogenase/glutarate-semialdehyde dehydrogenase